MEKKYDNSFTAFTNQRKETPKHADFSGTLTIEGKEYWINIWKKGADKNGNPWISGSVRPKESKSNVSAKTQTDQAYKPRDEDEDFSQIPF